MKPVRSIQPNKSIFAKAFRGELVPQAPSNEPASEVLARIRNNCEAEAARQPEKQSRRKAVGK